MAKIPLGNANLDFLDNLQSAVEGRLNSTNYSPPPSPTSSTFIRMIVLDVIFDPNNDLLDKKKSMSWSANTAERAAVSNPVYTNVLPRNTIVARVVGSDSPPMFVFPFFPSHLSMPCKPGECVWAMLEKPDAESSQMAFWFCKITEPHPSDDVNHSHPANSFETADSINLKDTFSDDKNGKSQSGENAWSELRNGPVVKVNGARKTASESLLLKGAPEDIFERLITQSDASRLAVYEPVPRFRKRPADLALEGSNNTLIVLGTDREGPAGSYDDPQADRDKLIRTKVVKYPPNDFKESAGSIDIVVGRGQVEEKFGKILKTTAITSTDAKGKELKKEINKTASFSKKLEGDLDYKNDRSRILVSQRTKVDSKFGLEEYNRGFFSDPGIEDSKDGDSAIVIKTDKIRLIARSDVEIVVTNFDVQKSPAGADVKQEKKDANLFASITIKTSGDIVFTPSEKGFIKLGDDSADRALLCTDVPASLIDGNVSVTTAPIMNTMGGSFGGTNIPGQGTWASKILVTGAR